MANHTGTISVHPTLTATSVDTVTLTDSDDNGELTAVTVVNRTGGAEIYFTVGNVTSEPEAPSVKGANSYVVPAAISSVTVTAFNTGGVVVKLISSGAEAYSVEIID